MRYAKFLVIKILLLASIPWRLFKYSIDYIKFSRLSSWPINLYPCLFDWDKSAGELGEYFWQDFYVAREVISLNPSRHIDVGSKIDGFVAHIACYREVEYYDIRPLDYQIKNVKFSQWDLTRGDLNSKEIADCVTCLHTIEHIGLGRYGDQLNADGWKAALQGFCGLLIKNGNLWISIPIGVERVEFNAHRIFDPRVFKEYAESLQLRLVNFSYLRNSEVILSKNIFDNMKFLAKNKYTLGIFQFRK